MSYNVVQDGTHAFGIPESPVTIATVDYALNGFTTGQGSNVPVINNPNGVPAGQVIVPGLFTATGQLQLATLGTRVPLVGEGFTANGADWLLTNVSKIRQQGNYIFVDISANMKINA